MNEKIPHSRYIASAVGFGFIVFAASLLSCRFPVLIQRVTRQVYLVILIYARPALVKLHLTEKPMYQHQRAIAFYPVDILFHIVQHRLAVVKRHPQTIPRQSFDIPYSWYHNCTFFQVGLLTLLILVLIVQLDFIIPEEKKKEHVSVKRCCFAMGYEACQNCHPY